MTNKKPQLQAKLRELSEQIERTQDANTVGLLADKYRDIENELLELEGM